MLQVDKGRKARTTLNRDKTGLKGYRTFKKNSMTGRVAPLTYSGQVGIGLYFDLNACTTRQIGLFCWLVVILRSV